MNSWKHGLCAEQLLIPGDVPTYYKGQPVLEDPEKLLDELMDKMYEELNPQGLLEGAFAAEVVGCLVRLRRVKHHEAAIMRSHYDEDALEASGESPFPAGIQWLADINLLSVYEKRIMSNLRYFRQELASAKLERMREEYARMQMELQARNYAIGNAESATQRRENAHGSGPAELMHNAQRTAHRSNGTNEPNEPELHPSSVASNVADGSERSGDRRSQPSGAGVCASDHDEATTQSSGHANGSTAAESRHNAQRTTHPQKRTNEPIEPEMGRKDTQKGRRRDNGHGRHHPRDGRHGRPDPYGTS